MKKFLLVLVACGLMATTANAAFVWLENADNGSNVIDIPGGDSGWMYAKIQIAAVDSPMLGWNLRFDTDVPLNVAATQWTPLGPSWTSGRAQNPPTPFPPGPLGSLGGYGIWSAEATVVPGDLVGAGTYIMDEILFADDTEYTALVTINLSSAGSEFYYNGGSYSRYPIPGDPAPIPNWYSLGTGDETLPLTVIVPEPASLALLGIGALALIRRR